MKPVFISTSKWNDFFDVHILDVNVEFPQGMYCYILRNNFSPHFEIKSSLIAMVFAGWLHWWPTNFDELTIGFSFVAKASSKTHWVWRRDGIALLTTKDFNQSMACVSGSVMLHKQHSTYQSERYRIAKSHTKIESHYLNICYLSPVISDRSYKTIWNWLVHALQRKGCHICLWRTGLAKHAWCWQ